MASDNEASCCESDPNFAVICAFWEKFGNTCGLANVDFIDLQSMLENTHEVSQELIDLHIKLLRKSRKSVSNERWERAVIKFCHTFCIQDAWEIERFGYKKARLSSKIRILKELLELQFDYNVRFKTEVNKIPASELRSQPLGKDKSGHAYWFQSDDNCQIRVYKEDPDEETWMLVAKDREGLVNLINDLGDGDSKISSESTVNEDSNSLAEKPIIDTGQIESDSNESKKTVNINISQDVGVQSDSLSNKESSSEDEESGSELRKRSIDQVGDDEAKPKKRFKPDSSTEEPLMLVKNGNPNTDLIPDKAKVEDNPIVGEEIEESMMHVRGLGSGVDCQTGNDQKSSNNSEIRKSKTEEIGANKFSERTPSGENSISIVESANKKVPTSTKSPYKLGTIIDTKTDIKSAPLAKSPKRKSRWDVETVVSQSSDGALKISETSAVQTKETDHKCETKTSEKIFSKITKKCLENQQFSSKVTGNIETSEQRSQNISANSKNNQETHGIITDKTNDINQTTVSSETTDSHSLTISDEIAVKSSIETNELTINSEKVEEGSLTVSDETNESFIPKTASNKTVEEKSLFVSDKTIQEYSITVSTEKNEHRPVSMSSGKIEKCPITVSNKTVKHSDETVVASPEKHLITPTSKTNENQSENVTHETKDKIEKLPFTATSKTIEKQSDETIKKEITTDSDRVVYTEINEHSLVESSEITEESSVTISNQSTERSDKTVEERPVVISSKTIDDSEREVACKTIEKPPETPISTETTIDCIETKEQENSGLAIENDKIVDDAPKKAMFFFGPGCLQFAAKPVVPSVTLAFGSSNTEEKVDAPTQIEENIETNNEDVPSINTRHDPIEMKSDDIEKGNVCLKSDAQITKSEENLLSGSDEISSPIQITAEKPEIVTVDSSEKKSKDDCDVFEISQNESCVLMKMEKKSDSVDGIDLISVGNTDKCEVIAKNEEETTGSIKRDGLVDENVDLGNAAATTFAENATEKSDIEQSGTVMEKIVLGKPKIAETDNLDRARDFDAPRIENIPNESQNVINDLEEQIKEASISESVESQVLDLSSNKKSLPVSENIEPVVEEPCIKKVAYILGKEDDADVEDHNEVTGLKQDAIVPNSMSHKRDDTKMDQSSDIAAVQQYKHQKRNNQLIERFENDQNKFEAVQTKQFEAKVGEIDDAEMNKSPKEDLIDENKTGLEKSQSEENLTNEICDLNELKSEVADSKIINVEKVQENEAIRIIENVSEEADVPKRSEDTLKILSESNEVPEPIKQKPDEVKVDVVEEAESSILPRRGRSRTAIVEKSEQKPENEVGKKIKLSSPQKDPEEVKSKLDIMIDAKIKEKPESSAAKPPDEKSEESDDAGASYASPLAAIVVDSSSSNDVLEIDAHDPLAISGDEEKSNNPTEEKPMMTLSSFSLDFNDTPAEVSPIIKRALRKRGRESPENVPDRDETAEKRMKIRGKRNVDVKLRKSIEKQKMQDLASSDDEEIKDKKSPSKKNAVEKKKIKEDSSGEEAKSAVLKSKKSDKSINRNKRLLQNLGISPGSNVDLDESPMGVRQSRRIAQIKIKEEALRRKLEEDIMKDAQDKHKTKKNKKAEDKDYKAEKRKPIKVEQVEDESSSESDSGDKKKPKKRKRSKDPRKLFDEHNPWRSSSDSSSSHNEEEEEEIAEYSEEEPALLFQSDHEFSPESDLGEDEEIQPMKRARTARKESDVEEGDDCPCQRCLKSDHPEWILLCDRCDNGWHCSCLRPPLLVIPEGDWFCPPCEHVTLLQKLQEKLGEYDKKLNKKEIEDRRKERLAYVGISLNNVLPAKDPEQSKKRRRDSKASSSEENEEDSQESESGSESESDSDEPIYQLRQRRQAHSYRFNDYDELINSAIQDEMEAVKGAGNQGRGKDIATIVQAEKEEEKVDATAQPLDLTPEPLPPVVPPVETPVKEDIKDEDSDDEPIQPVKKSVYRKKHRKLNSLDVSSGDDTESDEDFKGTSSESEEEFEEDLGSEDSEMFVGGRRKNSGPVRRSTRARTSRYDADFIDDRDSGDVDDEEEAPRRKKKKSIWDESESEESDRSWGRRKRKQTGKVQRRSTVQKKKKTKKKKNVLEDSDAEVYGKKKPKIKFGNLEDGGIGRRTRGKKITYVDALGTDSEEERVKRAPPKIESEEEYVANEDDELEDEDKISEEEDSMDEEGGAKKAKLKPPPHVSAESERISVTSMSAPTKGDTEVDGGEDEMNPIDEINKNLEEMDENEMEKMMEEEEYANKQLQLVALQIEKEKKRKEKEAKKLELQNVARQQPQQPSPQVQAQLPPEQPPAPKKRGRKPKNKVQSVPARLNESSIVENMAGLVGNPDNNDELSEPPGVSLPLFSELSSLNSEELPKKRRGRGRSKKSLEEAVANLGSGKQQEMAQPQQLSPFSSVISKRGAPDGQENNIEIAAPPQPFSQSQPTPSVITRMLQAKPGQAGYPVGTIRPKQFAAMSERDEDGAANPQGLSNLPPTTGPPIGHHPMPPVSTHHNGPPGHYLTGALRNQISSPFRQIPATMNPYVRGTPSPHQIRNPVPQAMPSHMYHSHRPLDPSPSGGGAINMSEHGSPGPVASPAPSSPGAIKNDTPPPPYSRPPVSRFPLVNNPSPIPVNSIPRHMHMVSPHLQARPTMSPYHPNLPPNYHYGSYPPPSLTEDAMPPTSYQNSPYSEHFSNEGGQSVHPSENSNSKSFDEESGGEFGGLVSYFSSQREDDLES